MGRSSKDLFENKLKNPIYCEILYRITFNSSQNQHQLNTVSALAKAMNKSQSTVFELVTNLKEDGYLSYKDWQEVLPDYPNTKKKFGKVDKRKRVFEVDFRHINNSFLEYIFFKRKQRLNQLNKGIQDQLLLLQDSSFLNEKFTKRFFENKIMMDIFYRTFKVLNYTEGVLTKFYWTTVDDIFGELIQLFISDSIKEFVMKLEKLNHSKSSKTHKFSSEEIKDIYDLIFFVKNDLKQGLSNQIVNNVFKHIFEETRQVGLKV